MIKRVALLGTGYIGSSLIEELSKRGMLIRASTTTFSKTQELKNRVEDVHVLLGSDTGKVKEFLADCQACIVTVAPKQGVDYQTTYLQTAKAIAKARVPLKHLIYTSSTSVYGDHSGEPVDEDIEPKPDSLEAQGLLETESIYLKHLLKETKVTVLRLGGIFGPGRELEARVKKFSGKRIGGRGDAFVNLVHRDAVICAILWSLEKGLIGIFNVVNETSLTREQLYANIAKKMQLQNMIWDEKIPSRHVGNKRVSSAKLKATGFNLKTLQDLDFCR